MFPISKLHHALGTLVMITVVSCTGSQPIPATSIAALPPSPTRAAPSTITPTDTPVPSSTPLPTWTATPIVTPGGIFVEASVSAGPISPYVYGTNYGPWNSVPYDLKDEAIAARLAYLRFPGGAYGDDNLLQNWQIDTYIALCKELGSEPAISVRLRDGSPTEAAGFVSYVNVTKGYNVRYWSIGNEPSLFATANRMEYDTVRFNTDWRAFAEAMRAVDPSILLVGPDIHQFTANLDANPKDAAGRDWLREFLLANGDLVDIVSIHRYPFPRSTTSGPATLAELRENSKEWDLIIPALRDLIRETTGKDLPVAVTEINSDWSQVCCGEATPDSFYNAIWWGDSLGRMIRQGVDIVAHFVIQSAPGGAGAGMGLLANYEVRPSYYVYRMYSHFGNERVQATSDDPLVSAFAARRQDGALTIMLINLGPDAIQKNLTLEGFSQVYELETWLFDKEHFAEETASPLFTNGAAVELPAQSMSLYIFKP